MDSMRHCWSSTWRFCCRLMFEENVLHDATNCFGFRLHFRSSASSDLDLTVSLALCDTRESLISFWFLYLLQMFFLKIFSSFKRLKETCEVIPNSLWVLLSFSLTKWLVFKKKLIENTGDTVLKSKGKTTNSFPDNYNLHPSYLL